MSKRRATRHNGRKGKNGIFKAGHNDRSFNVENAEHVDENRCFMNVYWDCYQGLNVADADGVRPKRKHNFDEIERAYYFEKFSDSVDAQNERHEKSRHRERIRKLDDVLTDPRTCPEESVYQLGTKDGYEDPALFVQVVTELFEEMEKRYGSNFKILDWALHMDESTPHVHERHVFFADDGYGTLFPKQEKACEELGFSLPDPEKKPGMKNSRKMSFDAEVRNVFISIAEKHGVTVERIPLDGKVHLEKNDFILARQEEEIRQKRGVLSEMDEFLSSKRNESEKLRKELDELTLKTSDLDGLVNEVTDAAYEKAVELVTDAVKTETLRANVALIEKYDGEIQKNETDCTQDQRRFASRLLSGLTDYLREKTCDLTALLKKVLHDPDVKKRHQNEIAKAARASILERLAQGRREAARRNAERQQENRQRQNKKENERS